jgi:hypothetical protein
VQRGAVSTEAALDSSSYPEQLLGLLGRAGDSTNGEPALSSGLRLARS